MAYPVRLLLAALTCAVLMSTCAAQTITIPIPHGPVKAPEGKEPWKDWRPGQEFWVMPDQPLYPGVFWPLSKSERGAARMLKLFAADDYKGVLAEIDGTITFGLRPMTKVKLLELVESPKPAGVQLAEVRVLTGAATDQAGFLPAAMLATDSPELTKSAAAITIDDRKLLFQAYLAYFDEALSKAAKDCIDARYVRGHRLEFETLAAKHLEDDRSGLMKRQKVDADQLRQVVAFGFAQGWNEKYTDR